MKPQLDTLIRHATGIAVLATALAHGPTFAQMTDLSNTPLSTSSTAAVLPNLMFVLDASGSMGRDYLPDFVSDSGNCKPRSGGSTSCEPGTPPYYSAQFNTIFYNPQITYAPAVNYDGSSKGNYGSPWTSVKDDVFDSGSGSTATATAAVRSANKTGSTPNPPSSIARPRPMTVSCTGIRRPRDQSWLQHRLRWSPKAGEP
jgi:hypothetical protein